MKHLLITAAVVAATAGVASAATVTNATVSPTKTSNGTFLAGSGIPATGFVITTADGTGGTASTGDAIALKPRNRKSTLTTISGNRYSIVADSTPGTVDDTDFSLDYQFTPAGATAGVYNNYTYLFFFDQDPTAGSSSGVSVGGAFFDSNTDPNDGSFDDGDGFFTSGYSPGDAPFVVSNSINVSEFSPLTTVGTQYRTPGEYTIRLSVFDGPISSGTLIGTSEAVAVVSPVPEPVTLLGGGSLLGALVLRRRRPVA